MGQAVLITESTADFREALGEGGALLQQLRAVHINGSGVILSRASDGTFSVSFGGFAPADDPRFTIYVVIHNPRNGGGGGSVAGPVFSQLMSHTLQRYAVPPTGRKPTILPTTW